MNNGVKFIHRSLTLGQDLLTSAADGVTLPLVCDYGG